MCETGQPLRAVLREPWPVTLLVYDQIDEMRHFKSIEAFGNRIDAANLTAIAFHEPKKLSLAHHRFEEAAGLLPTVEETIEKGLAMLPPEEREKVEAQRRVVRSM